jgi:hypothetical protein
LAQGAQLFGKLICHVKGFGYLRLKSWAISYNLIAKSSHFPPQGSKPLAGAVMQFES